MATAATASIGRFERPLPDACLQIMQPAPAKLEMVTVALTVPKAPEAARRVESSQPGPLGSPDAPITPSRGSATTPSLFRAFLVAASVP